ncbi:MAG: biopolymer transporter Tol [candidate division KSB1 bacterium]|nr:biopolymer transporter Tol [candidate division KSB1 bacterium]MDZ7339928.1 biopolymer transporter Tol [candidate division KSB1 bacterium]
MNRLNIIIGSMLIMVGWGAHVISQPVEYNHPELEWYTIDSEHFQVHYHKEAERTAALVTKIAEEIYAPITSLYLYEPDGKIHFIIRDHDDYSNGGAYYYDNKIEIWATPMDFVLRGNHNWLRNVVTHEFTHMISLGAARKITRKVPGLYFQYMGYEPEKNPYVLYGFPNRIVSYPLAMTIIPNWLAEGAAQIQLAKLNYDNWDSHRDMILRTSVVEGELLDHKEMGVFGKNSLDNERVYNQGYALVRYLAETYGVEALRRIFREMQKPWHLTIDGALKNVIGKSEKQLYLEWRNHLREMYTYRLAKIKDHQSVGRIIQADGFANLFAAWSPDGSKFAFISNRGSDYLSQSSLYLYNKTTRETKKIKSGVSSSLSWSPDGQKIAYSRKSKPNRNGSHFNDIYVYDLKTKKERQITRNMRAESPDWSDDGKKLLFVTTRDGTQNIAVLDLSSKKLTYLTRFRDGQQVFTPRWSNNSQVIIFSLSQGEGRQLAMISADGKTLKVLLADGNDARDPIFAYNGREIYFSWDRTGIFNIYSMDIFTKTKTQLTNVIGGAFMPSVNKQGQLIYSQFTAQGYKIALMDKPQPVEEKRTEYVAYHRPLLQLASADSKDIELIDRGISDRTIHYNDADIPRYTSQAYDLTYGSLAFLPRIMIDYGTTKLGTYVYSSDMLNRYDIFGGFAINRDWDYDLFGIVNYRQFRPTVFLEVYNRVLHHQEMDDLPLSETDTVFTNFKFKYNLTEVDLGLDFKLNDENNLRPAFIYNLYQASYQPEYKYRGQEFPTFKYRYFIGRTLQLAWNYRNVTPSMTSEINPAAGRVISLRYNQEFNKFLKDFKLTRYGTWTEAFDDYNYSKLELDWKEYVPLFARGRHALNWQLQAGWIDRPVHEFFNFYAGGLLGLRGYPFYSIEGRKLLIGRAAYRFPIFNDMNWRLFHLHFDKLYLGTFFDYGNAFNADELDFAQFKKDAGIELRLDLFSFYSFPTRIFFNAAYGFDEVTKRENETTVLMYGKEWRYYLGIAFGYFD